MFRPAVCLALAFFLAASQSRAEITVATVGDSLADAIYLGLKLQPSLLRQDGIQLMRWSRPKIGLTRVDYFDYTAWLRDTDSLGHADFCVVEMGANDLQSISIGRLKWIRVGTEDWQRAYTGRVGILVDMLKSRRCSKIAWLLPPAFQNKFLSQYHEMISAVQLAGSAPAAAAFEIVAGAHDYSPDGIHPNKDFCFRLGRAVANLLTAWQQPFAGTDCASCHASSSASHRTPSLIPSRLINLGPLVLRRAE